MTFTDPLHTDYLLTQIQSIITLLSDTPFDLLRPKLIKNNLSTHFSRYIFLSSHNISSYMPTATPKTKRGGVRHSAKLHKQKQKHHTTSNRNITTSTHQRHSKVSTLSTTAPAIIGVSYGEQEHRHSRDYSATQPYSQTPHPSQRHKLLTTLSLSLTSILKRSFHSKNSRSTTPVKVQHLSNESAPRFTFKNTTHIRHSNPITHIMIPRRAHRISISHKTISSLFVIITHLRTFSTASRRHAGWRPGQPIPSSSLPSQTPLSQTPPLQTSQPQLAQTPHPSLKKRPTITGKLICTEEDLEYFQNVIHRQLGRIYQINQPIPHFIGFRCAQITAAHHSDVAIYTFRHQHTVDPTQNVDHINKNIQFQYIEHLQPHLHHNTLSLSLPPLLTNSEINEKYNLYDPSTLQYHQFQLMQDILSHLLHNMMQHTQQQYNMLSIPTFSLPTQPHHGLGISFASNNTKDYHNLVTTTLETLLKCYNNDNGFLYHWFKHEIINLIPYTESNEFKIMQAQSQNNFHQFVNNKAPVNVVVEGGQVIDMNEGIDDPNLVNNVIKDLGLNPHNLSQKEFDRVYAEVDKILQNRDITSKDIYSDDEEIEEGDQSDEIVTDIEQIENTQALEESIQNAKQLPHKKIKNQNKGDIGDILSENEEIYPQDQRMYHGILSQQAIDAIEVCEAEEAAATNLPEITVKSLSNTQSDKDINNLSEFAGKFVYIGAFYQEFLKKRRLFPKDKSLFIQYQLLQTLTPRDVHNHFKLLFSPLFSQQQHSDNNNHNYNNFSNSQTFQTVHFPTVSVSGPGCHLPSILSLFDHCYKSLPPNPTSTSSSTPITPHFPIIHYDLPPQQALSFVNTAIEFIPTTQEIITNFISPTRFIPTNLDINALETIHLPTSIHQSLDIIDINSVGVDHSKLYGIDKNQWLKSLLLNKQKLISHKDVAITTDRAWKIAALTAPLTDNNVNMDDNPNLAFQNYQNEPLEIKNRINIILEQCALHVITEIVYNHFNKHHNSHISHGELNDGDLNYVITRYNQTQEVDDVHINKFGTRRFELHDVPTLNILSTNNTTGDTPSSNHDNNNNRAQFDLISTVDTHISHFMGKLLKLLDYDNIFSVNNILDGIMAIQELISIEIDHLYALSKRDISTGSTTPRKSHSSPLEDLLLAKSYLPLLIFGNSPEFNVTGTVATLCSLHFDTLFKQHYLSNNQRKFTLSTTPTPLLPQHHEHYDNENAIITLDDAVEYDFLDGETVNANTLFQNYQQHADYVAQYITSYTPHHNRLRSRDITFDFERHNEMKHSKKSLPRIRHLLGGQVYVPVPPYYNTNPISLPDRPNINNKKEFDVKWISTINSPDHPGFKAKTYHAKTYPGDDDEIIMKKNKIFEQTDNFFNELHNNRHIDCLVTSQLNYKRSIKEQINGSVQKPMYHLIPPPNNGYHNINNEENSQNQSNITLNEHTLNMTYTKQQQQTPTLSQHYIPLTKQLARPIFIEIDDCCSNNIAIDVKLANLEQRLTPYQMLLLPLIEYLFNHTLRINDNVNDEHVNSDTLLDENANISYNSLYNKLINEYGVDIKMKFDYIEDDEASENKASQVSQNSSRSLQCIVSTKCHVHHIDEVATVLTKLLTSVDFTDNIVQAISSYSGALTTTMNTNDENDQSLRGNGQEHDEHGEFSTDAAKQQLFTNSAELSFYHANSRLHLSQNSSSDPNMHYTLLNIMRGLFNHQSTTSQLSIIFNELQHNPNTQSDTYKLKLNALPEYWQNIILYGTQPSPVDIMTGASDVLYAKKGVSPMLMLLVNDIAETFKCLLLGPIENQFVHIPSSPHPEAPHQHFNTNTCNNNYFTLNSNNMVIDPIKPIQTLVQCDAFKPFNPAASLPIPSSAILQSSSFKHKFDPTYANIYNPNAGLYGLSAIHLRTNKHTLTNPAYAGILTTSLSKLINSSYSSQHTAYPPESSLIGCLLHQDNVGKFISVKTMNSKSNLPPPHVQRDNSLHQGDNFSNLHLLDELSDVEALGEQLDPNINTNTTIPTVVNTTIIAPLLNVRNTFTTPDRGTAQISQYGAVHIVKSGEIPIAQMLEPNGDITTHLSGKDWLVVQNAQDHGVIQVKNKQSESIFSENNVIEKNQQRVNQYIAVPVASTSTTISFPTPCFTLNQNNRMNQTNDMKIGLLFLGKLMLDHLFTYSHANNVVIDSNNVSNSINYNDQVDLFLSLLTNNAVNSKNNTSGRGFSLVTYFNPIDGVFSIQHNKEMSLSSHSQNRSTAITEYQPQSAKKTKKLHDLNECNTIVETLRVFFSRFIESNIQNNNNNNNNTNVNHIGATHYSFDEEIFDAIKLKVLSSFKDNNISPITQYDPSQSLPPNQAFIPSHAMVTAVKHATPAQVMQVIQSILSFNKAKVTVIGPIDDIPQAIESDAKTTNGSWSLHVV